MTDLSKFIAAQAPVYEQALTELRTGRKQSHWMWFIFPQIAGLGSSEMSRRFALNSLAEARDYLNDAVLGSRLKACTEAILLNADRSVTDILGTPDDMKFRSSMTLFHRAGPEVGLFKQAIETFFGGEQDPRTLDILGLSDQPHRASESRPHTEPS